jgi:hypothetical protein
MDQLNYKHQMLLELANLSIGFGHLAPWDKINSMKPYRETFNVG